LKSKSGIGTLVAARVRVQRRKPFTASSSFDAADSASRQTPSSFNSVASRACDLLNEVEDYLAIFEHRGGLGGADLATLAGRIDRVLTAVQAAVRFEHAVGDDCADLIAQIENLQQRAASAITSGSFADIRPLVESARLRIRAMSNEPCECEPQVDQAAAASADENALAAASALHDRSLAAEIAEFTRADACAGLTRRATQASKDAPLLRISHSE
jgi:hypothetical protein